MNTLSPRQQQALACGLSAFDRACLARRRARRAWSVGGALALALAIGLMVSHMQRATRLPDYVQILSSDAQVTAELELANACERIDRSEGRLVVVECSWPASPATGAPPHRDHGQPAG